MAAMPAPATTLPTAPLRWDIFCRVIDNFGDIGVCWRLARDLHTRGHQVRLWVDNPAALGWMAGGGGQPGIEVRRWMDVADDPAADTTPGDVIIEAFGCDLPASFIAAMAKAASTGSAPVWLNLEYLSAESYVERSHGLKSPQFSGPGAGLDKWFFYPGFTHKTGGLLREPGLIQHLDTLDRAAWLSRAGICWQPGETLVSLFCYPGAPIAEWLKALPPEPTLLLTAPGAATQSVEAQQLPSHIRQHALPFLPQESFDELLAVCDVNLVRGEDSFVRAQWAGRPFLWHIYSQEDGVHAGKLDAFIDRHVAGAPTAVAEQLRAAMRRWNGLDASPMQWPERAGWSDLTRAWRQELLAQNDLVTQLLQFVAEKR